MYVCFYLAAFQYRYDFMLFLVELILLNGSLVILYKLNFSFYCVWNEDVSSWKQGRM